MLKWFETLADEHWLPPDEQGAEEAQFIMRALRLRKGKAVLDAPCGAGRVSVHLAHRGCQVTGVDLRRTFVNRARRRFRQEGVPGRFVVADLRELDFESEFDAIFNWYGSFGYFTDAENADLVRRYARALRPNGRLLIGQPNREYILRHFLREIPMANVVSRNSWDPKAKRVITRRYVDGVYDPKNISSMRLYSPAEMTEMLVRAGLTLVGMYGSVTGEAYVKSSRQMYVVGRKL